MGHRAYVLYERDDGLFNVHYSHWGAHDLELVTKISETAPLGGESNEPPYIGAFMSMLEGGVPDDYEVTGALTEAQETTAVSPQPDMAGVTLRDVMAEVDLWIEAVFIVDRSFDVTGYHCLHSDEGALLYEPNWFGEKPTTLSYTKGYFRALKEVLPHNEAVDHFLGKIEDSLSETVLAKSPAVDERRLREYAPAFVKMGGRTRKGFEPWMDHVPEDSYMVATSVVEPPRWALPSRFEIETTEGNWKPA